MIQKKQRSLVSLDLAPREPENAELMIMLHGYGSNEKDLIQLGPILNEKLRYVSARAPHALDIGMYGWFPIEFTSNGITVDYEAAKEARNQLTGFIEEIIADYRPRGNRVWLMGFSQGSVMSYLTAFERPDLLHGVIACSGQLPQRETVPEKNVEKLRQLPFLVMHGLFDDVLPIAKGEEANRLLKDILADLTYQEFPMAHEISPAALHLASEWLRAHTPEE
ncbi:MAG: phospholipase [Chlorobium sp.]|jgi:phospholipase/carboxylesterase|uniref:alpha/beta hydrolase n=1 Tax=Chlorobium sp. TaxID=1095 RepID=UPI001DF96041|nr:phospholipase [Chlorobium sp.]MBN1278797.1 phospholipase [Chlorobiaceae bacterium]MCF8216077.1 phospholipase [Chlorobium sp.]MCF8270978.1 phospholipase [Chlorobium sp.]MCF8287376.1 phospholipase [Chlorobium sp.]MCF8290891.1 phospholipase [Chlorobium sp.]